MKVFCLLSNLGARYDPFTTSMLKPPMPSYAELIPLIQRYEIHTFFHDLAFNASFSLYGQRNGGVAAFSGHRDGGRSQQWSFSSCGHGFHPTSHLAREGNTSPRPNEPNNNKPTMTKAHDPPIVCQICDKKGHVAF